MKRYQLRYPQKKSLNDLAEEVAHAVSRHAGSAFSDSLRAAVRQVLEQHVTQYDLCGLGVACEESMVSGPWRGADLPRLPADSVTRYVLEVSARPEELIIELSEKLAAQASAGVPKLRELVGQGLKEGLGPYLYENICCGETLLCRDAEKLNPWKDIPPSK